MFSQFHVVHQARKYVDNFVVLTSEEGLVFTDKPERNA